MAVRRWRVDADGARELPNGTFNTVSLEALAQSAYELAVVLHRSGGVGTILVGRQKTELEGEFVTTDAILEWKDRTDARPQPEKPVTLVDEPEPLPLVEEPENGHVEPVEA